MPISLVRKWAGHFRLSTTEVYADAIDEEEQAIAAKFWQSFQAEASPPQTCGMGVARINGDGWVTGCLPIRPASCVDA